MYCEYYNIRVSNIYRNTYEIIVLVMFHKFRSCRVQLLHTGKSQGFIRCGQLRCVCKPTKVAPSVSVISHCLLAKNNLLIRGETRNFCSEGLFALLIYQSIQTFIHIQKHMHLYTYTKISIFHNEILKIKCFIELN